MLAMTVGCSALPEVAYETDRLQIAPDFDDPICEGTLLALDEHLEEVEYGLGMPGGNDPFRLYWMRDGLEDTCGDGRGGCFFPSTRIMFARSHSITHEMTHAVLDSEGESYFLEEGMAELLSGVGVYHRLEQDGQGPAERLRLSRSAYRSGGFDYEAAAHFMRYIYDHRGVHGVRRLAGEVEDGASPEQLEGVLEQMMGMSIEELDARYRQDADQAYEGLSYARTEALRVEELEADPEHAGPEGFVVDVEVRLDCAGPETMGPLPLEAPGMYQVRRVRIPANAGARLRVSGDAGTWVDLFDPYGSWRRGRMTDWMLPDPEVDEEAVHLESGQERVMVMPAGTYAVVLGSDHVQPRRVSLRIELKNFPPPPDPTQAR